MASGTPRATKAAMQKPGKNGLPGGFKGGGCQENKGVVLYAHAQPPSRNAGAMYVLVQRAYFSAWRMVLVRPSVMSGKRVLPCGSVLYGIVLRSLIAFTMALPP